MKKPKYYMIHSAKLAGWIMLNGIMYKDTIRDLKRDNKIVFRFMDTPKLHKLMDSYGKNNPLQNCSTLYNVK